MTIICALTLSGLMGGFLILRSHERAGDSELIHEHSGKFQDQKARMRESGREGTRKLLLSNDDLNLLPDIVDFSANEANQMVLMEIGVPYDYIKDASEILLDIYNEARRSRGIDAGENRFLLGEPVIIPAMSSGRIEMLVSDAATKLLGLENTFNAESRMNSEIVDGIKTLLRHQLKTEFACELTVTLTKSQVIMTYGAHIPIKYHGLEFNVVKKAYDGSMDRFSLDPIQSRHSRYFFLNVEK